jgi:hypothetical protein
MAPGTWVLSTRVNKSIVPTPSSNFWSEYDGNYAFMGGTSMSTPLVAGAAAIVRQYFMEAEGFEPSAALIKAALINGAEDIATPDIPNNSEGWGRMNLTRTLQPGPGGSLLHIDNSSGLNDDESVTFQFDVLNDSLPFKVSLVWSDYKGNPNFDGELINNLDLLVENNISGSYLGNEFSGGWSVANTSLFDTDNNVECVYIETPVVGRYNVTIDAPGITNGPQSFALIATGVLRNDSVLPPAGLNILPEPEGEALNLSWWPNIGSDISSYNIYRSNITADNFQLIAGVAHSQSPSYIDTGLENKKEYYYKLKTINTIGSESPFSDIRKGIPEDSSPPKLTFNHPDNGSKLHGNVSLDYYADPDTLRVGFYYYLDLDKDGLPDDNNSWVEIGWDETPTTSFFWNTVSGSNGSGPGDSESVILMAVVQDISGNNKSVYLVGILIDNTLPAAPVLHSIDGTIVNEAHFEVGGTSEPLATVELFINGQTAVTNTTNITGQFTYSVTLNEGLNNFTTVAYDEVGNGPSATSEPQIVVLDRAAPVSDTGGPYNVNIGSTFILNGSGSHDHEPDSDYYFIQNYTWIVTGELLTYYYGEMPKVTLYKFGEYSVSLTVRDAAGNSNSDLTPLIVGDSLIPVVSAGGNRTIDEDEWIYFDVLNSSDNDPEFFNTSLFKWTVTTPGGESTSFAGLNLSYFFADMGLYEIVLTVTDAHNNTGSDTIYITARDITAPKAVSGGDMNAVEHHEIEFNATLSTDNDPTFPATAIFTWTLSKTGYQDIVLTGLTITYTFIETGVIEVVLTATDQAGNSGTDKFLISIMKDLNPPEIIRNVPEESAREVSLDTEITCTFSERIKHYLIDNRDFFVQDSDGLDIFGAYSYDEITNTIKFTPNKTLSSNEIYHVTLKNTIEDLAGNQLIQDYSWFFSTVTPPLILQFKPEPDSRENKLPSKITVIFNEPILSSSISPEVLKIFDISGNSIDGIVEYDNSTFSINFIPLSELKYNSEYRAELRNIIIDLQGNNLEENQKWYFTTGPEPEDSNRFNNTLFLSLVFVILVIIVIMVLLVGTGRLQLPLTADKKGERLPPPPPPPAGSSRTTRSISKVHKVRTKRRPRGARGEDYSDWDDDEYDDYEDELEGEIDTDWDDEGEDYDEDEPVYEDSDSTKEDNEDDDIEPADDIEVDWQDD